MLRDPLVHKSPTEEDPPAGPEIFIGLVGAVGTNLDAVSKSVNAALRGVRYHCETIRLSELFDEIEQSTLPGWSGVLDDSSQDMHLSTRMDFGDRFRKELGEDAVAVFAMLRVRRRRRQLEREGVRRRAFLLRSLKHPDEVRVLRDTYGSNFFLIGAYSPEDTRIDYLARQIARDKHVEDASRFKSEAVTLIARDRLEEGMAFGQQVRDTFPMADFFVDARIPNGRPDDLDREVKRFVEIVFDHPYHTPDRDEHAMFHAKAAALRSAALGRQVGASVTNDEGDVLAVGTNEVPKAHGGQYWSTDEHDNRDYLRETDDSVEMKRLVAEQILDCLKGDRPSSSWLKKSRLGASTEQFLDLITGTRVRDLIEFERSTHAEMAAILDAGRRAVSVSKGTLYTTTFPCHECTRHITTAGIKRVVYIEPYPKSLAERFHDDSIAIDSDDPPTDKVRYEPFVGVAPRRYLELFTASDRRIVGKRREAAPSLLPKSLRPPVAMDPEVAEPPENQNPEQEEKVGKSEKTEQDQLTDTAQPGSVLAESTPSDATTSVLQDPAIRFQESRNIAAFLELLRSKDVRLTEGG